MPKVEQYGANRFNTGVATGPRARTADSGIQNLAAGAGQLADGLSIMQKKRDETEAEDALVKFEREKNDLFFSPKTGYFNTNGRDAYDGAPVISESLDKLKETYAGQFKSSTAREMFNKVADNHITRARVDIDRHSTKGLDTWEMATIEATIENSLEDAALYHTQPEKLLEFRIAGERQAALAADKAGIGAEAKAEKLQNFRSSFAKNALLAAVNSSSAAATDLMNVKAHGDGTTYGEMLEGPDKVDIDAKIVAKQKSEHTQYVTSQGIALATKAVNSSQDRGQVMEALGNIEDPELRDKAISEAMYLWNQKETVKKEQSVASYNDADLYVRSGNSINQWISQNPDAWENLTPTQRKNLTSGDNIKTDMTRYNQIRAMSEQEFLKLDVSREGGLSPSDQKKLIDKQYSLRNPTGSEATDHQVGRTRAAQTTDVLEKVIGTKSTKWSKVQKERADLFYGLIDAEKDFRETQKGAKLTSQEFTDMLHQLSADMVIEDSLFGMIPWDRKAPLLEAVNEIPREKLDQIREKLRSANPPIPETPAVIWGMYERRDKSLD